MKTLTYNEMLLKLKEHYPTLEILDSSEFSKETSPNEGFWLRNASEVTYTEKDKNTILANENEPNSRLYEIDVYKKFDLFCQRFGWYATTESYVLQICKIIW